MDLANRDGAILMGGIQSTCTQVKNTCNHGKEQNQLREGSKKEAQRRAEVKPTDLDC